MVTCGGLCGLVCVCVWVNGWWVSGWVGVCFFCVCACVCVVVVVVGWVGMHSEQPENRGPARLPRMRGGVVGGWVGG